MARFNRVKRLIIEQCSIFKNKWKRRGISLSDVYRKSNFQFLLMRKEFRLEWPNWTWIPFALCFFTSFSAHYFISSRKIPQAVRWFFFSEGRSWGFSPKRMAATKVIGIIFDWRTFPTNETNELVGGFMAQPPSLNCLKWARGSRRNGYRIVWDAF